MNLYSYSQDKNIEAGVLTKAGSFATKLWDGEAGLDESAWNYFDRVIEHSVLLFHQKPIYESTMLGLTKKFKESVIEVDRLSEFFSDRKKFEAFNRKEEKKTEQQLEIKITPIGYCIRTGKQIPFNLKHPMSEEAYQSWSKYKNKDYQEKYCHFTGEESNGETSYGKPILIKNWKKAKEMHRL